MIGSDVLYEQQHSLQLAQVVSRAVVPGGQIVIADPARPYLQGFVDELTRFGFDSETQIRVAEDRPIAKEIFMVNFQKRSV